MKSRVKEDPLETLRKKVKLLESHLKESEDKRKKSIIDQHEAEYATRKIKAENEQLKIENSCLNNILDLQKSKNETHFQSQTKPPSSHIFLPDEEVPQDQEPLPQQKPVLEGKHRQDPQQPQDCELEQQQKLQEPNDPLVQLHEPLVQDPRKQEIQSSIKVSRSYKEALDTMKKSEEIIFTCTECTYPFRSKEELKIHTMRHNQLHCTKCNKDFETKLDLKFHINYENNCERQ